MLLFSWWFFLRVLSESGFFILTSVIQPVLFATIAFELFRTGRGEDTLLYAALGAGMMGIWSSTLFGSGGQIQYARFRGVLELQVLAPPSYLLVLVPGMLATSTLGVYSLVATLAWGRLLFGMPLHLAHPWLFLPSVVTAVVGLGLLGIVLASTFVLWRYANAFSNLLEYPIWLVTGLIVPLHFLPHWVSWLSYPLSPTWAAKAIRAAALDGYGSPWAPMGYCLALGLAYFALGALTVANFERLARAKATLALA
jgi:ABC-type polysaccharide/polyol phosphate export permease